MILYQLHNYEIVDIYKDKAVKISDQCLANYILYYVFIKNKWMKLSEMIRYTFKLNKVQTVMSVNVLSNIFITEHNQDYLVSQIKELWDNLSIEDPIFFWEYVKVFYRANPSDALLLIRDKIDSIAEVVLKSDDLSLDERYNVVNDDILLILGVASVIHTLNVKNTTVRKELPITLLISTVFAVLLSDNLFDKNVVLIVFPSDSIIFSIYSLRISSFELFILSF